ncbi:MAG: proton-conducting transporter membrane subunit [Chloroflexota bacterium]
MTLALCLAAPLVGAVLVALFGDRLGRRGMALVTVASLVLACLATLAMAQAFASGRATIVVELGSWLPIRGSSLGLVATAESIPLLLAATVGPALLIAVVARGGSGASARGFYSGAAVLGAAATTIAVGADLLLVAAGWQLAGIATHLLMGGVPGRRDVARPGARGFVLHRAGDMAFLLAVGSFVALLGTSDLGEIARRVDLSLPQDARDRVAGSLALPSVLVVAGVVGTAALPFRSVIAAWRDAPPATRVLAAVVAVAPAVALLVRLSGILHPGILAIGVAIAVAVAALRMDVGVIARASEAGARALEGGMESALERAVGVVTSLIGRASSVAQRTERSYLRVREAALLASALGLLAYWSLR